MSRPTLYHAPNTRALRVLWTLEELGATCDLKSIPFPPRRLQPSYLEINPSGTLPALVDGDLVLTESVAICETLAERHGPSPLVVPSGDSARPDYLQWLWYGESATLMVPMAIMVRLGRLESPGDDVAAVLADARASLLLRLAPLERRLEGREFLAADRLTLADISCGFPLHFLELMKADDVLGPRTRAYRARLRSRPAFKRAAAAP